MSGMIAPADLPNLLPALPEIVLAVGAMVLLLAGVFQRARTLGRDRRRGHPAADRSRCDRSSGSRPESW